jgi:hypothetical protein
MAGNAKENFRIHYSEDKGGTRLQNVAKLPPDYMESCPKSSHSPLHKIGGIALSVISVIVSPEISTEPESRHFVCSKTDYFSNSSAGTYNIRQTTSL